MPFTVTVFLRGYLFIVNYFLTISSFNEQTRRISLWHNKYVNVPNISEAIAAHIGLFGEHPCRYCGN